jgi:hypothetical protein
LLISFYMHKYISIDTIHILGNVNYSMYIEANTRKTSFCLRSATGKERFNLISKNRNHANKNTFDQSEMFCLFPYLLGAKYK